MRIEIRAHTLPGRRRLEYDNVHVGIQRGRAVEDLFAGDAPTASWAIEVEHTVMVAGPDFRGPHVQGTRGTRFIYLSWGTVDGAGHFSMFRRTKLLLGTVDAALLAEAEAEADGSLLVGRLGLTDHCGMPRCAAVKPPLIRWSVEPVEPVEKAAP